MVSELLRLGANGQSLTDGDETPLHLAARQGKTQVAKLLVHEANANARHNFHRTPLHLAIGADGEEVFQVIYLLSERNGKSALRQAIVFNIIAQILLRYRHTDLKASMDDGTTPVILAAKHDY